MSGAECECKAEPDLIVDAMGCRLMQYAAANGRIRCKRGRSSIQGLTPKNKGLQVQGMTYVCTNERLHASTLFHYSADGSIEDVV